MNLLVRSVVVTALLGSSLAPARAAFTSLYVFGDGVCTTTNWAVAPTNLYYGYRNSNGRVWVEVLAQRQGLPYNPTNNWSYLGHSSTNLVQDVGSFTAPDAGTGLFIIWVSDADFVGDMNSFGDPHRISDHGTNVTLWANAINQSLTNHWNAVTNLYAKGVHTLIMPNAVDLTKIPQYVGSPASYKSFVRQQIINFDTTFANILNQIRTNCPGLSIYMPDAFSVVENILSRPGDFGLTNALYQGQSIDAVEDPTLTDKSLNGPGANYVFWDYIDPTARAHMVLADVVQQMISPVQIATVVSLGPSNRLDIANVPIGRNGFVDSSPGLASSWTPLANITSTNTPQSVLVPESDPAAFYRLRFPFAWSWP